MALYEIQPRKAYTSLISNKINGSIHDRNDLSDLNHVALFGDGSLGGIESSLIDQSAWLL